MLSRRSAARSTTRDMCTFGRTPRADVFEPPLRQLRWRTSAVAAPGEHPAWEFVAAHGGSGAGLLARLSRSEVTGRAASESQPTRAEPERSATYALTAGRGWPDPSLEPTDAVIVVAQTAMRGLCWARDAAAQHLAGRTPAGTRLLGLVTIADQPGRLPPPLQTARNLLAGTYSKVWDIRYVPEYRLLTGLPGETCPPIYPAVADVLAEIRSIITTEGRHA